MHIHSKVLGVYILVLAGIIGYIGFTLEDSNTLLFGIPNPRTYEFVNVTPLPDITCFLKTKVFVLQLDGSLIAVDDSPFLGGNSGINPLLSTVVTKDPQSREADAFQVWGKMRCPQEIITTPLIVERTEIELKVFSQDSLQNKVLTHHSKIFTISPVTLVGNTEETIFIFQKIKFDDILSRLDKGAYDSWHKFDVNGNVRMHWEGFPEASMLLNIPIGSIPTFIQTTFTNEIGKEEPTGLNCVAPKVEINGACQEPVQQIPEKPQENIKEFKDCPNSTSVPIDQECPSPADTVIELMQELSGCIILYDEDCLKQTKFFGIYALSAGVLILGVAFSGKKSPASVQY